MSETSGIFPFKQFEEDFFMMDLIKGTVYNAYHHFQSEQSLNIGVLRGLINLTVDKNWTNFNS